MNTKPHTAHTQMKLTSESPLSIPPQKQYALIYLFKNHLECIFVHWLLLQVFGLNYKVKNLSNPEPKYMYVFVAFHLTCYNLRCHQ